MESKLHDLAARYSRALESYLKEGGEAALTEAYEIGRIALAEDVGVLEMATLYHQALVTALKDAATPEEAARIVKGAEGFFVESLSPFEMSQRGVREANAVLRRINETMEEQARRIAHALHDEAGQLLASVHIGLDELSHELPAMLSGRLQGVKQFLDQIEEELRRLSHELRPTILDDLGLFPALEFLAEGVSKRARIPIAVEGSTAGRLPSPIETAVYRVVQQGLSNAARHAGAGRVTVRVERENHALRCSVRDDGVGFDVAATFSKKGDRGIGLIGMRERISSLGGRFQVISAPRRGTELLITIPLEE